MVLLDGFYEWTDAAGGRKQPYHVSAAIPVPPQPQDQEHGEQQEQPDASEAGGKAGAAPPATGSGFTCMYMAGLYDEYRGEHGSWISPAPSSGLVMDGAVGRACSACALRAASVAQPPKTYCATLIFCLSVSFLLRNPEPTPCSPDPHTGEVLPSVTIITTDSSPPLVGGLCTSVCCGCYVGQQGAGYGWGLVGLLWSGGQGRAGAVVAVCAVDVGAHEGAIEVLLGTLQLVRCSTANWN